MGTVDYISPEAICDLNTGEIASGQRKVNNSNKY